MNNRYCDSYNYCKYCHSCNYCDYCDSCNYCDYCKYCHSCDDCDYCDSCEFCDYCKNLVNGFMCINLKFEEKDINKFWIFNKEVTEDEWKNRFSIGTQ